MSYFLRFVDATADPVAPTALCEVLGAKSTDYSFELTQTQVLVHHSGKPVALLEVNVPGDGLFEQELEELVEFAEAETGERVADVVGHLRRAHSIIAAQILFSGGDSEEPMRRLEPLWEWLFAARDGLLQVDAAGYYDGAGLVLRAE